MRVISGTYRRRRLEGPAGLEARPTSDRLRETVFDILQPLIEGARFLDLCAGSGAVGIEALSRGAAHATFVDHALAMVELARANLAHCGVPAGDYAVVKSDALAFLDGATTGKQGPWDLIYYDPPYQTDYSPILELLGAGTDQPIASGSLVLVEHNRKNPLPETVGKLARVRQLRHGETCVDFYQIG